jgi:hypothetical protein
MDFLLAIVTHLVIPGMLLFVLVAKPADSTLGFSFQCAALSAPALVMSLGGAEWLSISTHLRYLPLLAIAPCCFFGWRRRPSGARRQNHFRQKVGLVASVACVLVEGSVLAIIMQGFTTPQVPALSLHRPVQHPRLVVMNGGSSIALNSHFGVNAQRYALDISAENSWGRKYRGLMPRRLQDYEVFGVPVVAPCSGEVTGLQTGQQDLVGANVEARLPVGNGVALHCHGVTLVLAHLQDGSIRVQKGQLVRAGDVLASAGNSGNTTEPHLHIHAVRGRVTERQELLFDGEAVPLRFEPSGSWPVRGTRF